MPPIVTHNSDSCALESTNRLIPARMHQAVTSSTAAQASVTVPTLVLAGEGDTAAPAEAVATIAAAIPGARYEVLPGAHLVNIEHSETYTRLLAAFVDGLSGSPTPSGANY